MKPASKADTVPAVAEAPTTRVPADLATLVAQTRVVSIQSAHGPLNSPNHAQNSPTARLTPQRLGRREAALRKNEE